MEDVKIYKMNDFDWVAARSKEEAISFYEAAFCFYSYYECGDEPRLCDMEKEHMWVPKAYLPVDFDKSAYLSGWFGGEPSLHMPFKEAIKYMLVGNDIPILIATTEY